MGRVAGALVIATAMVGALTLSVFARIGVTGFPAAAPAPDIPSIGDCVARLGSAVKVVDCGEPHMAEVTAAFPNSQSPAPRRSSRTPSTYQLCQQAASSYVGDETAEMNSNWVVPPLFFSVQIASGPGAVVVPGWSWRVCMVAPTVPQVQITGYVGRLTDRAQGRLSAALHSCFNVVTVGDDTAGTASSFTSGTACVGDHAGEVIGVRTLSLNHSLDGSTNPSGGVDSDPSRVAGCLALARQRTGTADPTFQGRLQLQIRLVVTGTTYSVGLAPGNNHAGGATVSLSSVTYTATCVLQASGGRQLFDSLVGLGTEPLPLR